MRSRLWLVPVAALALALGVSACGSSTNTTNNGAGLPAGMINGAGSTFAAPIYQQWGSAVKDKGITVNYSPVGSGAGVTQFATGQAEFGASDPALTPEDRKAANKGDAVQIPTAFGAITVSYNVPGAPKGLKLDGKTIADIFLGKVKTWNDPEIKALNAGANLPSQSITVVHRSDASGTTKGFTTFLSDYSPQWKSQVGADKTVKWPTGTGAKGNDGVAAGVKQQQGAIGYVEEAFALQNNFTTASVKNKSGAFVAPTLASTTAAGEGISVPKDLGISIIDSPNPQAYPIASQTFVLVYKDMCKAGVAQQAAQRVKSFLVYGLGPGQQVLGQLQYAKLPAAILSKAKTAAGSLKCKGNDL